MVRSAALLLFATACLSGCGSAFGEKLGCTSSSGQETTISIIKEQIEKKISSESEGI
ncbi:hypothetical protein [Novosphingobium sp. MD-1]|nr:hypothetical protein [Novosphingobium sp. MD-1]